jgi:hypothetical protein
LTQAYIIWAGPRRRILHYRGHKLVGIFHDNKPIFSEKPKGEVEAERYVDRTIAKSNENSGKECQE